MNPLPRLRAALASQPPLRLALRLLALVALAALLYLAWAELYFLTDDAFITFRYVDHHRRGWGYSWNPPPFRPVEGYSNFLWAVVLEAIWAVTGAPPPASANVASLLFAYGTLALGFLLVWRAPLPERWQRARFWVAALGLLYPLTHRTFLTWTSSGLETALFGFCVMIWVFGAIEIGRRPDVRWLAVAAAGASAAALTRPDGLLIVLATLALAAYLIARQRRLGRPLLGLVPLAAMVIHLLWRRAYYGDWVPNTYHAKHVSAWPEAGTRYTTSFILEHAIWAWALVPVALLAWRLPRLVRQRPALTAVLDRVPAAVVAGTLLAHVGYYTFVVGGDHFEYRIYAHLVVPMGVALVSFLVALPGHPAIAAAVFLLVVGLGQPIPWTHYRHTRALSTRAETFKLFRPIADFMPAGPLRWYARWFDELQAWMHERHVGTRHQEHKIFFVHQVERFPSRREGNKVRWEPDRPVWTFRSIGVPGWAMPEVAIIDHHGLNDRVIARTPVSTPPGVRFMAHERTPPPGYIACFRPNVVTDPQGIDVRPRATPLTDDDIRACETRSWTAP